MAVNFRTLRKFMAPRWLTDGDGGLVGYTLDVLKDAFVRRLELGHLARLPQNDPTGITTAPADALAAQGRDRRVTRGIDETDAAYAVRLKRWLDDRRTTGNPYTLMRKLSEFLGPGPSYRTVDARGNWYSRAADGTQTRLLKAGNWNWSGPVGDRWARYWVILYPNGRWAPSTHNWGDGAGPNWGADTAGTMGTTATHNESAGVRAVVADWKPAGTKCVSVVIAFDSSSFNPAAPEPDGLWEGWSKNVGGVQVPARLATARYWDGL